MFHRSARLLLRPIWPEDWKGVLGGIADQAIVRNLSSAPWPYGEADARKFVALPIDPKFPRFLVTRARDASVVGCIGLDPHEGDVELGYWIARPHWGKGCATEAGGAVIEIARALGHSRIVASHFLDNPASGRVLGKLGFATTGRVVERHSCARGEMVKAVEHELVLSGEAMEEDQAAA